MKRTLGMVTLVLGVGWIVAPAGIAAQESASFGAGGAAAARPAALRVYLDCPRWFCDSDYLRTEITFVNYVRDRHDAQVHILVTRQETGGGGSAYTLNFIGRGRFEGKADTLRYDSPQGATDDERRRGIAHVLRLGLVRYAAHSPLAGAIRVTLEDAAAIDAGAGDATAESADDPWNYWVFGVGLNGSVDGESLEQASEFGARLSANRTTNAWKIGLGARFGYDEDRIELEDQTIHSIERTYYLGGSAVRSIGSNFSLGVRGSIGRPPARENRERSIRIAPAIEYSAFPYEESNQRRLLVTYSTGTNDVRYHEETIYFKTRETLYDHDLSIAYGARQPWGSAGVQLRGSHYLSYLDRYSVRFSGNIDLRLTRGLSLNLRGDFAHVNDQIGLPAGEVDIDEVLLRRRQLATDYEYGARIGFNYRFGSIFNNVVNPRLDDWD